MYGDYTAYIAFYGDKGLKEVDYMKLGIKADRLMDAYTTTLDNVRKLKTAFPTDEDAIESVKLCHCEIVHVLWQIEEAEKTAESARGYEVTANGMRGKVVTSMSAGNESISYSAANTGIATAIEKAIGDASEQRKMILDIIKTYLSGIEDANGVSLMYVGRYPVRVV